MMTAREPHVVGGWGESRTAPPPRRVLVVDDDAPTRALIRRILQRVGDHAVDEAHDGNAAVARLDADPFDVVLSDYRMGSVSGIDVLCFALERQPAARRVLMSGFADEAVLEGARLRARIHHFFEKPMTPAAFEEALALAMGWGRDPPS